MAIVTFHSEASGNFFFLPDTLKTVFEVLGRPYSEQGAIDAEEVTAWITKLEAACAKEREELRREEEEKKRREDEIFRSFRTPGRQNASKFAAEDELAEEELKKKTRVTFSARVFPLLKMLKAAEKKGKPVMWGVP